MPVSEEEVEAAWSLLRKFFSYDRELIREALEAAAQVREREAKEACTHPRKTHGGSINSDGSGQQDWLCHACGASGHNEWPAKAIVGEGKSDG